MKAFHKSAIPFPPMVLDPGSCHAERISNALEVDGNIVPLAMTPEESERKQRAYEQQRAAYREQNKTISV